VTPLRDFLEKLARPPEEIRAENLRAWASSISGAKPIGQVQQRERTKVAGVIQNIRIDPREGSGSIEATLIDGSGELIAKWLGRHSMSGIQLGMGVIVEGAIGIGTDKSPMILNPEYTLVPGPEHG
jgi:hypothetical protein